MAHRVPRYDLKGKRLLEVHEKYYLGDTGIRHALLGYREADVSGILENAVFLELKHRGARVYFHRGRRECDFVVVDRGAVREAFQVCYELTEGNAARELAGLKAALRQFGLSHGTVLTYNDTGAEELGEGQTAQVLPTWQWMIEGAHEVEITDSP